MRESVGTAWIYGLVLTFTLIFSGFLVLALSYSKAYKLKNEVTSMIEKYEGLTTTGAYNNGGSIKIINQYLQNSGYSTMGSCLENDWGVSDLESYNALERAVQGKKYYYCVSYHTNEKCRTIFRVTLFYNFNLPVLGQMRKYMVSGQTNEVFGAYFNGSQIQCEL